MRQVIAVAGVTSVGGTPWYGEHGAALLVAAPTNGGSLGISTTSLSGGCTNSFGGTSSAAPLAAGVVALMLDARPELTWRDVQQVLALSAVKVNPGHAGWFDNGAGLHFNEFYGYGMVDAGAAVELATTWDLLGPGLAFTSPVRTPAIAIPNAGAGGGATDSIEVDSDVEAVEHVEVVFSASHQRRGQMEVTLVSPAGTEIRLLRRRSADTSGTAFSNWKFGANAFRGENPDGDWTLRVRDAVTDGFSGTWQNWQLIVHGTGAIGPAPGGDLEGVGEYTDVLVGESSAVATFVLSSTGDLPLIVETLPTLDDATHFVLAGTTCTAAADLGTDGSCSIDVRFAPQAEGAQSTTLRVETNAGEFSLPLAGTGIAPSGQLTGTTAYPDVRLGQSSVGNIFTLTSDGSAALVVATVPVLDDTTHFAITANTCLAGADLGETGTCSIGVALAPTVIGPVSTTLRVTTNAGEHALVLSGEGIDPRGVLSGDAAFGVSVVGSAGATRTFTLASNGTTALQIESAAALDDTTHFEIVTSGCTNGTDLGTTNTCTVDVHFTPEATGTLATTLRVTTNAGEIALQLAGIGIDPHATLAGDVAFGDSALAGGGVLHTFTLASTGDTALIVESAAALDNTDHFAIVASTCTAAADLGASGSCTIEVRFLPAATGPQSTTLRVVTNAGERTLALTGTGIDPQATLSGDPAFGDTAVGSTIVARVFTLRSSGTTALVLSESAVLDDDTHFSILVNSCVADGNLGLGSSCTVAIVFSPLAAGALATTLRIATNAGEFTADLTGNGTVPVALFADGFENPASE